MSIEIEIKNMEFGYNKEYNVLEGINLHLKGPQFVSIIGPNGVGKSTLIHCMNRILTPTVGEVLVNGKNVSEYTLRDLSKIIGYVPYKSSGTFPMNVIDAVLMGRNPHAKWRTTAEDLKVVEETMKKLDIEDLAERNYNELSAGQHQRVLLARGLVQKPSILLLDEPTANLDVKYQLGIARILQKLTREDRIMVIMISHDLNIASKYSDNIILLNDRRIWAIGKPNEVMTSENISSVYGVDCEVMNKDGWPMVILKDDEYAESKPVDEILCSTSCD